MTFLPLYNNIDNFIAMAQKDTSGRKKENIEDDGQKEVKDDLEEERKNKRKARRKQRKEERKSKTTGVGLKISLDRDSAPTNKKIVFDDSNLPTEEDDNDDSTNDKHKDERLHSKITMEEDDDDDAVEEVQGKAARDKVMDQMKTEAKQSLKTKKKRKRKKRKENNSDDEEMDDEFFAQLDSVREVELEEKKELEKSAARAALKGKHTTFVFAKNKDDDEAVSDPVQINENIQVVVLKNSSSSASEATGTSSFFAPNASISQKALRYSRNRLNDGSDPAAGATEMKRKRNHSGEVIQPWTRARQRLSMGRSRLTKGKPAAFFKTKKR
jgi:hypothetical protein